MKKERGITLVALVITVIIMLILAGVALSLITGEEGLFARANHAARLYENASQTEAEIINAILRGEYTSGGEGSGPTEPVKPDIPEPDITPTYIPETNINPSIYNGGKGVKVEITDNTDSGYQLQYSTDEGLSWYEYIAGETEIYVNKYNGTVLVQLYDIETDTAGANATINVTNIDTLAPEEFSYTEGEKTGTTITISGSTKDRVNVEKSASSGIKYKYAIQSSKTEPNWESIEATTETEKTFDKLTGTGKSLKEETTYYVYMLAIDEAGNITKAENNGTAIATEKIKPKVGDYINYDAGNWTAEDLAKIRNSDGSPTVTGEKEIPWTSKEFGGFKIGDSRNSNSSTNSGMWVPRTSGWRIWDIDGDTGEVTIIHAGNPETYRHDNDSTASINILRNRDCSMYENSYAKEKSAHFLKGWEAAEWYTENCGEGETYTLGHEGDTGIVDLGERSFYKDNLSKLVSAENKLVIEVLENGSFYWLASAFDTNYLFLVSPSTRDVRESYYSAHGVRPLVTLQSDILLQLDGQSRDGWNQWKIVEN